MYVAHRLMALEERKMMNVFDEAFYDDIKANLEARGHCRRLGGRSLARSHKRRSYRCEVFRNRKEFRSVSVRRKTRRQDRTGIDILIGINEVRAIFV